MRVLEDTNTGKHLHPHTTRAQERKKKHGYSSAGLPKLSFNCGRTSCTPTGMRFDAKPFQQDDRIVGKCI